MEQKAVTWEGAVPAITWQDSAANNYNPDHRYTLLTPILPKFLGPRRRYTSKKNLKKKFFSKRRKQRLNFKKNAITI